MPRKQVKVVQSAEEPVAAEVLAKAVVDVADGARRLLESGLSIEALALLINHNIPFEQRPGVQVVKVVMRAAAGLDAFVMKKDRAS